MPWWFWAILAVAALGFFFGLTEVFERRRMARARVKFLRGMTCSSDEFLSLLGLEGDAGKLALQVRKWLAEQLNVPEDYLVPDLSMTALYPLGWDGVDATELFPLFDERFGTETFDRTEAGVPHTIMDVIARAVEKSRSANEGEAKLTAA